MAFHETIRHIEMRHNPLMVAPVHNHDCWEIILTLEGRGKDVFGEENRVFEPGSILVCPPDFSHGRLGGEPFKDIFIQFEGMSTITSLKRYNYIDNSDGFFKQMFLILHNLIHDRSVDYFGVAATLFDSMCELLAAWDDIRHEHPGVNELKNIIIREFTDPDFSISSAIKTTNFNADYIRRCFKEDMGMTPSAYLCHLRIRHAKKILCGSSAFKISVAEAAMRSGFLDPQYFCRIFKKETGVSPSEYRKTSFAPR